MNNGFRKWFSDFCFGSAILRGLDRLGTWLYKNLGQGIYSFAFGSYDAISETFENSAIGRSRGGKRGRLSRFLAENMEQSVYVKGVSGLMRYLSRLSLRVLGVFSMSCGFYALLAQLFLYLVLKSELNLPYGAVSVGLILLGIPLLFSGKALCTAVHDSFVFRWLAVEIGGFRERDFVVTGKPNGRKSAAFILGIPFGVLSAFVNPLLLLILAAGAVVAYVILLHPECGYYLTLFVLPFLVALPRPSILLALITLYTFFSFLIKLILGKRYYKPDLLDILVMCFMAVTAFGGIVTYGGAQSLRVAAIYTALMLGYFLTVGLMNSKENLKKAVMSLSLSLLLVSAYGLYQNFTGNISVEWIDTEMFDSIGGRVVSTFENPNMLGVYLILLMPILISGALGGRDWKSKPLHAVAFAAGALCLIYTWARGAWLGFLFAFVIFLLMWDRRTMGWILAAICALPFAIPYLPASIVSRFSSIGNLTDTSTNYRVYIWRGSVNMASDYALSGIGVGEDAFNRIYPYYSFAGIEKAPHAHNLFLQIFIEFGILGFILFLGLLICLFQNGFSLAKCGSDKEVRLIGCGALCGVIAALVQGMTDYVWYNYRVFFVFWVVFGIVAAARRVDCAVRRSRTMEYGETQMDITI